MLSPTEEQLDFAAEVRRFLARSCPLSRTRSVLESEPGYDPAAWVELARLGVAGLLIPVEYGGSGAGIADMGLVSEEMGRVVLASPFLSSAVLAASLLTLLGDEAAMAAHLPGIASGQTVATVAFLDDQGRWSPDRVGVRAERDGPSWTLSGRVEYVTDAKAAALLLIVAATDDGLAVFTVDPSQARITPLVCLDQTQPLSRIELTDALGIRIGVGADATSVLDRVARAGIACVTAAQLGGAQRCLELTVAYARTRVQFGRPIGAYQAIKHRCADMFMRVESARSAVYHLLSVTDLAPAMDPAADTDSAAEAASLAKAYCAEAFVACAADTIQIHGGIGFAWEHDAHLYFKRAKASAHLLGDPVYHRAALARALVS